jgi:hypothetical protein
MPSGTRSVIRTSPTVYKKLCSSSQIPGHLNKSEVFAIRPCFSEQFRQQVHYSCRRKTPPGGSGRKISIHKVRDTFRRKMGLAHSRTLMKPKKRQEEAGFLATTFEAYPLSSSQAQVYDSC